MVSYRGYIIPQSSDLTLLGQNIKYTTIMIKDPTGKLVDIGITRDELNKVNNIDRYIYEKAKRYINNSLGQFT